MPDFSTLGRRQKTIPVRLSSCRIPGPLNLLVDGAGIKVWGVRRDRGPGAAAQAR